MASSTLSERTLFWGAPCIQKINMIKLILIIKLINIVLKYLDKIAFQGCHLFIYHDTTVSGIERPPKIIWSKRFSMEHVILKYLPI